MNSNKKADGGVLIKNPYSYDLDLNYISGSDLDTIAQLVKKALEKEDIRVGGVVYDF